MLSIVPGSESVLCEGSPTAIIVILIDVIVAQDLGIQEERSCGKKNFS